MIPVRFGPPFVNIRLLAHQKSPLERPPRPRSLRSAVQKLLEKIHVKHTAMTLGLPKRWEAVTDLILRRGPRGWASAFRWLTTDHQ